MREQHQMLDFCSADSHEKQSVADGVTVRPFYLHSTCMAILEMAGNSVLPEHKHIHEQISYIIEGQVEVTVGGKTRTFSEGELFGVKSNVLHSFRAHGSGTKMIIASSPLLQDYVFGE